MTNAALRARPQDGGLLSVLFGEAAISTTAPITVDANRRTVSTWSSCEVRESGDTLEIFGSLDGAPLDARWSARRIAGEDVFEFSLELRNTSSAPVSVTRMDPLALLVGGDWTTHSYWSGWGDEFRPRTGRSAHDLVLESRAGRSSHGMSPWLGLERADSAVVVSPAWSGNWHIHAMSGGNITAGISPWQFEVVLAPGEAVDAPSVVVAVASDLDEAGLAIQRAAGADWMPRTAFTDSVPVEWNHWWPYEDQEVTEQVIFDNARIAADLGIAVATVDAGWFGAAEADTSWSQQRGDWTRINTARFPSGLVALGDGIRAAGALPGIWIEAEAVGYASQLRREHPEIMAHAVDGRRPDPSYGVMTESLDPDDPTFLGYVCLGSPAGREHVLGSMSWLVQQVGARWIKLDFNVDPDAGCTRTDHGHGAGDGLFRHYEGLYEVLQQFRERHPEVLLESCSSGGLRFDLGIARQVHGSFLSDPDYTEHHLEVLWGAARFMPPAGILHWSWSQWRGDFPGNQKDWASVEVPEFDRMLRAAMLHRFGVSLRLTELRPELADRLREHVRLFREVVTPFVRDGVLRPLTAPPERGGFGERVPVAQLDAGARHLIAAFDLDDGAAVHVAPRGLDPEVSYRVTDLATGAERVAAGSELAAGWTLSDGTDPATRSWLLLVEPAA
ncbi:alpha-galactosidase [Homoserinibacter sp. GY 40078]|uniref:alpha-galactosidase n=1 Tax=Homoserinibacter sp. GY 40078 TaxID=2603275 RepID=UPI0011CA8F77|nr:alpha-galactosidase [Homoserinibacter sp. GY 40078]TXK18770.1 alpha-galactosidase [Homoserinibacter sp. GY 40078]